MSMIQNHVSGNLYNKRFSESSEEKCTVFQIMDWYLIVRKNLHHLSPGVFLCILQDIFKNFAKFIGKLLCQSLSFDKVTG